MKLVQLLAKELKEWPESATFIVQDENKNVWSLDKGLDLSYSVNEWASEEWFNLVLVDGLEILINCLASDNKTSKVTQDQWQAEREKMNKPKWIRHRGGKCPVPRGTKVETRHRDGNTYSPHFHTQNSRSEVAMNAVWKHQGDKLDIMAYRIIEETKDQEIEEVETIDTAKEPTIEYAFGDKDSDPKDLDWKQLGTITYKLEIDATEATKEIDSLVAKWGQIESPLKWRDAIIHCQAIIEDCEREIERNVSLLDAEGLMMQKDSKKAMQHYQTDIDMSDWRNWENGDIIEVIKESETSNAKAGLYTITGFDSDHPKIELDERYFPEYANMKFVRRP